MSMCAAATGRGRPPADARENAGGQEASAVRLIGLDIGTSGCKAMIFDSRGARLASASCEYSVEAPHPGWAEQDAEAVWRLAQHALSQAIAAAGPGDPVAALSLSVQGEAVIAVDAGGRALRPAILGMDTRTVSQNEWLTAQLGAEHLFERTGMPVHTINTLPKLMWLKQHEPDVWAGAHQFLLYEDFLIRKMTGCAVISRCLASRTQLYDLPDDGWSGEILHAVELEPARLARVQPSGVVVGPMEPRLASALGLDRPPLVVTGGHDQACAALGAGLTQPGLAMISTGTAEVVEVALASPVLNETLRKGNMSVYAAVVPGLYLAMTLNHSGGMMLRWFRDTLCQADRQRAQAVAKDAYDLIFEGASPDPSPLMVLPHFSGSGTPWLDTASKGAILGLTFSTTKADISKAILEGVTFELRVNLDWLNQGGVGIDELRAVGGGARSELWLQLKADITGIPVVAPAVAEAACLGAALLAGVGAGCFTSASQASESTLRFVRRFEPDPARAARYEARYAIYRDLYPTLAPLSYRL